MTQSTLQKRTCKDLAEMAREQGVTGWHSMRKEQLIRALLSSAKAKSNRNSARAAALRDAGSQQGKNGLSEAKQALRLKSQRRMSQIRSKLDAVKNLSMSSPRIRTIFSTLVSSSSRSITTSLFSIFLRRCVIHFGISIFIFLRRSFCCRFRG